MSTDVYVLEQASPSTFIYPSQIHPAEPESGLSFGEGLPSKTLQLSKSASGIAEGLSEREVQILLSRLAISEGYASFDYTIIPGPPPIGGIPSLPKPLPQGIYPHQTPEPPTELLDDDDVLIAMALLGLLGE